MPKVSVQIRLPSPMRIAKINAELSVLPIGVAFLSSRRWKNSNPPASKSKPAASRTVNFEQRISARITPGPNRTLDLSHCHQIVCEYFARKTSIGILIATKILFFARSAIVKEGIGHDRISLGCVAHLVDHVDWPGHRFDAKGSNRTCDAGTHCSPREGKSSSLAGC